MTGHSCGSGEAAMTDRDSRYEIITDERALAGLQADWDALWKRAAGRYYLSFVFCWTAWQQVAKPKGRTLRCIIRRDEGRFAMVWPLALHHRLIWASLVPLSPEAADYSDILMEARAGTLPWIEGAWRIATGHCGADFVHLPYLHESADLYRIAGHDRSLVMRQRHISYVAKLSMECRRHDWTSFCDSLTALQQSKKPGSIARRLAKKGRLDAWLVDPSDKGAVASAIDLMLEWKRDWSDRVGKHGQWVASVHYRNFLVEWLSSPFTTEAHLLVVALDGAPLAALVFSIDNRCASTIISGFNQAYRNLSPGLLAFEYVVQWAFDRQFDLDFGAGTEQFKECWARGNLASVWTLRTVSSPWGCLGVRALHLQHEVMSHAKGTLQALRKTY
ncbi:GNAT family N-acetyltransferase [Paraburkholderia sp. DD10]|uniref:GNAT family N-acetyltransferase n=1 Tax=Paraburkholderia sp. DD10 TaxID=3409691 RepID=UPI003BA06EE5